MNSKNEQIIDASDKIWKRELEDYLLVLETCIHYEEISNKGQRYKAIMGFNRISGYIKTKGLGFLASKYFTMVKQDIWVNDFIQILEQLAFIDGRLSVLGNQGQVMNIDNDYLCQQFIKMHLT